MSRYGFRRMLTETLIFVKARQQRGYREPKKPIESLGYMFL